MVWSKSDSGAKASGGEARRRSPNEILTEPRLICATTVCTDIPTQTESPTARARVESSLGSRPIIGLSGTSIAVAVAGVTSGEMGEGAAAAVRAGCGAGLRVGAGETGAAGVWGTACAAGVIFAVAGAACCAWTPAGTGAFAGAGATGADGNAAFGFTATVSSPLPKNFFKLPNIWLVSIHVTIPAL